jgi:non-specific serine/threonine protein kinase/serine/threonine-protein kinase
VIGEGGMGSVYLASQTDPVKRQVALKLIKTGMDSKAVVARFEAERQALAMMDHANIARVYDAGTTESGRPYFVMELVKGVPVTEYCDSARLTPKERIELFIPICQAVQHAHQKGIIHRDIKPSNVLVTLHDGKPVPKVIDFGVAKATSQRLTEKTYFTEFRQMVGTPEYMSPEQAEMSGLDIDTRADVYSLGVLLYQLLTGLTPFDTRELRSKAYEEMQRLIREVDPPKPSTRVSSSEQLPTIAANRGIEPRQLTSTVRGELDWIVMKCLEKDRTRRYESASALVEDVRRYLANEPVVAGPVSASYRLRKLVRRHRVPFAVGALVLLLLIGGITGTTLGLLEARRQRDDARHQKREAEQANLNTQAVNEFLTNDLLASANPAASGDREITVRKVLDIAGKNVHTKFKDRPLIEATVRGTLARTYTAVGSDDLALPHAQAALDIRRATLGNDHPDTLASMHDLATLLEATGRLEEAQTLYRQAIETGRRVLGDDDLRVIQWNCYYSRALIDAGKYEQAAPIARDVLARRQRLLGEEHPDTLVAQHMMASVDMHRGRLREARLLFEKTLEKRRRVLGELDPDTLTSISDLALLLRHQDKPTEADPLYREAVQKFTQVLGADHPATLIAETNLAMCLWEENRLEEAAAVADDAAQRSRKALGSDHYVTITARLTLCDLLLEQKKPAEAEPGLREVLNDCVRILGADHRFTRRALNDLAGVLIDQSRLADAIPLLRQLLDSDLRTMGSADPKTVATARALANTLQKVGRTEEAEAVRARVATTRSTTSPTTSGSIP